MSSRHVLDTLPFRVRVILHMNPRKKYSGTASCRERHGSNDVAPNVLVLKQALFTAPDILAILPPKNVFKSQLKPTLLELKQRLKETSVNPRLHLPKPRLSWHFPVLPARLALDVQHLWWGCSSTLSGKTRLNSRHLLGCLGCNINCWRRGSPALAQNSDGQKHLLPNAPQAQRGHAPGNFWARSFSPIHCAQRSSATLCRFPNLWTSSSLSLASVQFSVRPKSKLGDVVPGGASGPALSTATVKFLS